MQADWPRTWLAFDTWDSENVASEAGTKGLPHFVHSALSPATCFHTVLYVATWSNLGREFPFIVISCEKGLRSLQQQACER
jgi:hypothetical protein